ncbi:MAG: serine/threonine-protein kinase, partial [Acidobacteria bacterium]
MNVDAWKRIEELYHASLERVPEERPGFLAEACAGDNGLRQEVEALLHYDDPAGNFIETSAFELVAKQWASDQSPEGATQAAVSSPVSGQIGTYQLLAPLASGGMGEVYLATDTRLKRKVAIKLMPLECAADQKRVRRFEQEALAASALNHPNILTVYETGQVDGRSYIVTEYIEGEMLRQRVSYAKDRPIEPMEALKIASQIASAAESAHAAGIIHRDLKPENIMVRPDGLVKVLDFGLAKISRSAGDSDAELVQRLSTQSGIVMGTVAYMSPEQARGQTLDHRTDIFSLGVILYEMLGQCRPFDGPTASDVIAAVLTRDPVPLSEIRRDVSPGLQRIVSRCLEKDRQKRFQSAQELRLALETLPSAIKARPDGSFAGLRRGLWTPVVTGLALGLFVLVLTLVSYVFQSGDNPEIAQRRGKAQREAKAKPRDYGPGANFAFTVPDGWILSWSDAPAVSPDGKQIVFSALPTSAEVGREVCLWVRDFDSSEATRLSGTEGAASPFWSPDSRFVAFWAKGMLRKIEVAGGAASTVCRAGRGFAGSWNEDGVILFPTLVALGSRLCHIQATGGEPVTMDSFADGETGRYDPRFLPDGRHFLYYSENQNSESNGLYVASLDSGRNRRLVLRDAGSAVYVSPGYLLFSRGNQLLAQRFDLQRLVLAGGPVVVAQGVASYAGGTGPPLSAFSASDNGLLVWKMQAGDSPGTALTWFDRSGRRLGTVGGQSDYSGPALSPDESH